MTSVDVGALEEAARAAAAAWGRELGPPFTLGRHSYVAPAGGDAVVKVIPREDDESDEEAEALELWAGEGAVRLLAQDRERRALLLERALPGEDIASLPEDEATEAAVETGLALWRPAGAPFRSVADHVPRWLLQAEGELGARARSLFGALAPGRSTLVHGDLQHQNILRSARGFLAIDPKPMLGEPEYDVAAFLWNPLPCRLRVEVLESRLAAFAAAGLDEWRMRAWTVVRGSYLQPQEAKALLALV